MHDQILAQGDVRPRLEAQLLNTDGTAPDLRNATVECRVMRADRSTQAAVTAATIVNARGGFVAHDWRSSEVARPGVLLVQFRRTDGSNVQTWPADRYLTVLVNAALAPPSLTAVPDPTPPADVDEVLATYPIVGDLGPAGNGVELTVDQAATVDFDDFDAPEVFFRLVGGVSVTGGTGTFRVRLDGTRGISDGAVVTTGTTISTTYELRGFEGSPIARPIGVHILKVSLEATAGQLASMRDLAISVVRPGS